LNKKMEEDSLAHNAAKVELERREGEVRDLEDTLLKAKEHLEAEQAKTLNLENQLDHVSEEHKAEKTSIILTHKEEVARLKRELAENQEKQAEEQLNLARELETIQKALAAFMQDEQAHSNAKKGWQEQETLYKKQISEVKERHTGLEDNRNLLQVELHALQIKSTKTERQLHEMEEKLEDIFFRTGAKLVKKIDNAKKEGWLMKMGGKNRFKEIKRRYHTLIGHQLAYSKQPGSKSLGIIELTVSSTYAIETIDESHGKRSDASDHDDTTPLFPFSVKAAPLSRRYVFCCSSEKARKAWMKALALTPASAVEESQNRTDHVEVKKDLQPVFQGFLRRFAADGKKFTKRWFAAYPNGTVKWDSQYSQYHQFKHSARILGMLTGDAALEDMAKRELDLAVQLKAAQLKSRLIILNTTGKLLQLVAEEEKEFEEFVDQVKQLLLIPTETEDEQESRNSLKREGGVVPELIARVESRRVDTLDGQLIKLTKGGKGRHKKFFEVHKDGVVKWGKTNQNFKYQEEIKGLSVVTHGLKLTPQETTQFFRLQTSGKDLLLLTDNAVARDAWVTFVRFTLDNLAVTKGQELVKEHRDSISKS